MEDIKMATRSSARLKETVVPEFAATEPSGAAVAEAYSDPIDPVLEHEEIAQLAYSYWETRGFCSGSPEEDWYRAEEELKRRAVAR